VNTLHIICLCFTLFWHTLHANNSWFARHYYRVDNMLLSLLVFSVVGHIKKTDGFLGLYRGLVPRLMSTYVNGFISATVADVSFCDSHAELTARQWNCNAELTTIQWNFSSIREQLYTGWLPTWKSRGISHWSRKSQGNCDLPVVCYHSCDSHKINRTWVLLSKIDMHKMDCK